MPWVRALLWLPSLPGCLEDRMAEYRHHPIVDMGHQIVLIGCQIDGMRRQIIDTRRQIAPIGPQTAHMRRQFVLPRPVTRLRLF